MIGEDLDKQVQDYFGYHRSTGAVINTPVVIARAEGILMYKDPGLLSRVNLTKGWAKYLLHRMGFVKRKATSKAKVTVDNCEELKEQFLLEINQVIVMDEIPADLRGHQRQDFLYKISIFYVFQKYFKISFVFQKYLI